MAASTEAGQSSAGPEQQKLSLDVAAGYGSAKGAEAKAKAEAEVSTFCDNWIVDRRQFDGAPSATLLCARILRCILMFFVVTSVAGLIVSFILRKSGGFAMEGEQQEAMEAPSPVLCPSPWGSQFSKFEVFSVSVGVVPGGEFHVVEHKVKPYNASASPALAGCQYVHIHEMLKPHGKPGEYTAFETVRVSFRASSEDGSYHFGFTNSDGPVPQRWSYGSLGLRLSGEIQTDNTVVGATDFTDGKAHSTLTFKPSGHKNITASGGDGTTELEFFYGYFMVRVLAATAEGISFFAFVTFVLLLAAALNNYGLFDFVFVEQSDGPQEPTKLEPNVALRVLCGPCLPCCKGREDKPTDEVGP
jgi:hypothetical protein